MEHLRWILPLIAAPVVAVLGIVGVIALSLRRLTSAPVASDDIMVLFGRDAYQFFLGTLVPLVLLLFIVGLIAYAVYAVGTTFGWIRLRETPLFKTWTLPLLFSPAVAVITFFVVAFMPFVSGPSEALVPVVSALGAFIVCLAIAGALWLRETLGARASRRAVDAAPATGEVGVAA
ncbi:hypothetical protein C5B85_08180 [Pseudoclavibacter sp. AY1F1]|uniref:hypothetical protein n=1 Tax=Pseudoclavibacter sp. AY1F1 TaxID=2080583 RepID=UPI000CE88A25|nr:hypothetical protein [Pseudoclavibacter sp. AY1F1]PPF45532.1 hypothetical protein C5B85_08180 [Pseudoclavibacter sp. AY1F1]